MWNCLWEAEFCYKHCQITTTMWKLTLHMHCTWVAEYTCALWTLFLNLCHTSRVTCTLMSISNSDIINTSQLSSLIHTKPFPWKKEPPKHAPITTVKVISFLSDWESTFWHCTIYIWPILKTWTRLMVSCLPTLNVNLQLCYASQFCFTVLYIQ